MALINNHIGSINRGPKTDAFNPVGPIGNFAIQAETFGAKYSIWCKVKRFYEATYYDRN